MSLSIVSSGAVLQESGTSIVVPVPSGLQTGDILLVLHGDQSSVSSAYAGNAAFTRLGPAFVPSSTDGRVIGIWARVIDDPGAEPASYSFARNGTATRSTATWLILRGAPAGAYLDVAVTDYDGDAVTNGRGVAALTVTVDDSVQIFFARAEFTAGQSHVPTTPPAGFTQIQNPQTGTGTTGSRSGAWSGYREVDAGVAPAASVVWAAASGPSAQSVVIRSMLPQAELGYFDGTTEQVGLASWFDGVTERPVSEVLGRQRRAYTVSQMDEDIANDVPVHWAHRGGSANWPEMTGRAYTNAVWHGLDCLEVSVQRSSDGVLIMMHDTNTSRITGGATSLDVVSTASSSLLGLDVVVGSPGGDLGRLEDIAESPYRDLVLIVDNKPGSFFDVFLDYLETIPNCFEHVIVKLDGQFGSVANFQAAKARGFKTAGYWYPNNYETYLPAREPYTDYIGMQYDATAPQWAAIAAYGKPIWAHVLQNQTQYNQSVAGGAAIFQCANVLALVPKTTGV